MFLNFSKKLYENLILSDFKTINQDYDNVLLTNETPFLAVEKFFGPNLFIVLIHNSCKHTIDYNLGITSQLSRQVNSGPMVLKYKQAIILNIFVTNNDKSKNDVKDLAIKTKGDNTNFVYNIYWNVNINNEKNTCELLIEKNQPKKILNIYKIVQECCQKALTKEESMTIGDITMSSIIKQNINLKSQNTWATFIFSILIFILSLFFSMYPERYISTPSLVENKEYYRLLTSVFVSSSLISNIISVIWFSVFATRVERHFGKVTMFLVFFISAIFYNVLILYNTLNFYGGIYGGIYGLAGALLILTIYRKKDIDRISFQNILIILGVMFIFDGKSLIIPNIVAVTTGLLIGIANFPNNKK